MYTIKKILFALICSSAFVSCKDDISENSDTKYNAEINNTVNLVIIPTYKDLDDVAGKLVSALGTLNNSRTSANLVDARHAWRVTRIPWEQSAGFLFGPAETQGIDPNIDSWPVNVEDLNAVLASSNDLTKSFIDGLEGTVKGFHAIEWLLFGLDGNKQIGDFSDRQFQYLQACAQSLKGYTSQLYDEWNSDGGNFGNTVKTAGEAGNGIYNSQKAVLQEFNNGIITIADEVGNRKIDDPFSSQDLLLVESRFSDNSKADLINNLKSIQNIYQVGNGLSTIVKSKNAVLDTEIRTAISAAITSIETIPGSFSDAIFNSKPEVSNAQTKVRDLQTLLESKLTPFLSSL